VTSAESDRLGAAAALGALGEFREDGETRGTATSRVQVVDDTADGWGAPHSESTLLQTLLTEFTHMARLLLVDKSLPGILQHVVRAAAVLIPEADAVSVTHRDRNGKLTTPAGATALACSLDEAQYRTGEGPCVSACGESSDTIVASDDLAADDRWPRFGPAAARMGARSVLTIGLYPERHLPRMGALNLYAREPGMLSNIDTTLPVLLAVHASTVLTAGEADVRAGQLGEALTTRDVIGQAKGIIMERQKVGADEAFTMLQGASQRLQIKLADVARRLTGQAGR
jgi:hypothetical protein